MKLEKEVKNLHFSDKLNRKRKRFDLVLKDFLSKEELDNYIKYYNKKVKVTLETEEPILDDKERKYLSNVIRPFRHEINYITKERFSTGNEYIFIYFKKNPNMYFPSFKPNSMYKGMELNKKYTLEDLEL